VDLKKEEIPMLEERIRFKALQDKVTDPTTAAKHIHDGTNLFISGFTAGYPKLIPLELARRAKAGEQFKVNLFAGASTGDEVDGIMAEAGVIGWRRPYMSSRSMRKKINENKIFF
jgi:acyl-CoA hydrolase